MQSTYMYLDINSKYSKFRLTVHLWKVSFKNYRQEPDVVAQANKLKTCKTKAETLPWVQV